MRQRNVIVLGTFAVGRGEATAAVTAVNGNDGSEASGRWADAHVKYRIAFLTRKIGAEKREKQKVEARA